jgi:hypothetical protein
LEGEETPIKGGSFRGSIVSFWPTLPEITGPSLLRWHQQGFFWLLFALGMQVYELLKMEMQLMDGSARSDTRDVDHLKIVDLPVQGKQNTT